MTRLRCCVPGCARTAQDVGQVEPPDDVWICGKHWRDVPGSMKAVKRRARKALRANPRDPTLLSRYERVSARATREAVNRAVGIK